MIWQQMHYPSWVLVLRRHLWLCSTEPRFGLRDLRTWPESVYTWAPAKLIRGKQFICLQRAKKERNPCNLCDFFLLWTMAEDRTNNVTLTLLMINCRPALTFSRSTQPHHPPHSALMFPASKTSLSILTGAVHMAKIHFVNKTNKIVQNTTKLFSLTPFKFNCIFASC